MLEATIWSQVVYNKGMYHAVFFTPVVALDFDLYQQLVIFSFPIQEYLVKLSITSISLFAFIVNGGKFCQYCSIRSVPLTVIKFLIIFMFVEFLIKKFFQSCSARTGFTPMNDAFVVLIVAKDLLDQVFLCQVPLHCTNQQHNILMSATNSNRVSHF